MSDVAVIHNLVQKRKWIKKNEIAKKLLWVRMRWSIRCYFCIFSRTRFFVGVPGLAKTLMVNTLAQAGLDFKRIQFTPGFNAFDILRPGRWDQSYAAQAALLEGNARAICYSRELCWLVLLCFGYTKPNSNRRDLSYRKHN
jgi:hypothetical protein